MSGLVQACSNLPSVWRLVGANTVLSALYLYQGRVTMYSSLEICTSLILPYL